MVFKHQAFQKIALAYQLFSMKIYHLTVNHVYYYWFVCVTQKKHSSEYIMDVDVTFSPI